MSAIRTALADDELNFGRFDTHRAVIRRYDFVSLRPLRAAVLRVVETSSSFEKKGLAPSERRKILTAKYGKAR